MKIKNCIWLFALCVLSFFISCSTDSGGTETEKEHSSTQEISLVGIQVTSLPYKITYDVNNQETFLIAGLSVERIYSDGSKKTCNNFSLSLADGTMLSDGCIFSESQLGSLDVIVKYSENDATYTTKFAITIVKPVINESNENTNPSENSDSSENEKPSETMSSLVVTQYPQIVYKAGSSLSLDGLALEWIDMNGNSHNFTFEYTVKIQSISSSVKNSVPTALSAGSFYVYIVYNDGRDEFSAYYTITVVDTNNISEFKYSNSGSDISIDGFLGTEDYNPNIGGYDYDAPYEVVVSSASDFIYDFIDGSNTDIVITGIKEDRLPLLTDITIPATLDGYLVKKIAWDALIYYQNDLYHSHGDTAVRNLTIEEGVEGFSRISSYTKSLDAKYIMSTLLPYLKKLVLPKGFSLANTDGNDTYNTAYSIYARGLEELELPSDLSKIDFCICSARLKSITVPEKVSTVTKADAFANNDSLEYITFLGKTDILAGSVFSWCPKLQEITFTGIVYPNQFVRTPIRKITLTASPSNDAQSITGVAAHFKDLDSLEEVIITTQADTVELGQSAFENCINLKSLIFSIKDDSTIIIGKKAFKNCKALENPLFTDGNPNMLVLDEAFAGQNKITSITFHAEKQYDLGEKSFEGAVLQKLTFERDCIVRRSLSDHTGEVFAGQCMLSCIDLSEARYVSVSFQGMKNLETVVIGNCFFDGNLKDCTALREIQLTDGSIFLPYSLQNTALTDVCIQQVLFSSELLKQRYPLTITTCNYEQNFKQLGTDEELVLEHNCENGFLSGCFHLRHVTFKNTIVPEYVFGTEQANENVEVSFFGLYNISQYAFYGANNVTFDFEKGCRGVNKYAFYGCDGITTLNVEMDDDGVFSIFGDYAFASCKNLKSVYLKGARFADCMYAFSDCENLETFTLVTNPYVEQWFSSDFLIPSGTFNNCGKLRSVNTSFSIKAFKDYSFYNCKNLESLNLPDSSEGMSFAPTSLNGCEKLVSIFEEKNLIVPGASIIFRGTGYVEDGINLTTLLNNISDVGVKNLAISYETYAYVPMSFAENNPYLQTVTVDCDIESRAFKGCSSLTTLILGNTTVHAVRPDSFEDCPQLTKIIVPSEYYERYKSSERWSSYKDLLCTE